MYIYYMGVRCNFMDPDLSLPERVMRSFDIGNKQQHVYTYPFFLNSGGKEAFTVRLVSYRKEENLMDAFDVMAFDAAVLERKVAHLIENPVSADSYIAKERVYRDAIYLHLSEYPKRTLERAVRKRVGIIHYLRRVLRASCFIKEHPRVDRNNDLSRLTTMFNRRKWCNIGEGVAEGSAAKISDINKVYQEIEGLRKPTSCRRFGAIPTASSLHVRGGLSRFGLEQQAILIALIDSQSWVGVVDTQYSLFGRGELCCN